mmetsp:Transcript_11661/g.31314  ORF Transcript_11661/g.31314 Transcript_11661/m.31314 type:complete len:293 (-) Transcript_11661:131-1009(-)
MPDLPPVAEGCRAILLSPLDIQFSQTRVRAEFQDGRTLLESLGEIKTVPLVAERAGDSDEDANATAAEKPSRCGDGDDSGQTANGCGETKEQLLLCPPFPRIEVTKWRCKLREADGTPRLDPVTGLELYSEEERWFTFDNRRLYCMQRAAVGSWPTKVVCEVIEVPQCLAKMRELRKFDTKTFGCSVAVGRRDDPNLESWSWRAAVGLPEEIQPEIGVARQKSTRWRGRAGSRGGRGVRRAPSGEASEDDGGVDILHSVLLFCIIYLAVRIIAIAWQSAVSRGGGANSTSPL